MHALVFLFFLVVPRHCSLLAELCRYSDHGDESCGVTIVLQQLTPAVITYHILSPVAEDLVDNAQCEAKTAEQLKALILGRFSPRTSVPGIGAVRIALL